ELEWHIPAYPTDNCIDTTGAGDCFAAGFLWALSENWPVPDCGCFANAVASCAIEKIGATDGVQSLDEATSRFQVVKNLLKSVN
ncbi:MAG: PfkB family carbohydrate kinase, partial [Clostridia bacterium]|nr:PfkB family carbohydrate kinase [Clostridia bacterium]